MVLYKSRNIVLSYNVAAAILAVDWPTMKEPTVKEVREGLQVLINYVRRYNIENLLLGESDTVFRADRAEYRIIVSQLVRALLTTRLKRVARVKTTNVEREEMVKLMVKMLEPGVVLKSFKTKTAAISWLAGLKVLQA